MGPGGGWTSPPSGGGGHPQQNGGSSPNLNGPPPPPAYMMAANNLGNAPPPGPMMVNGPTPPHLSSTPSPQHMMSGATPSPRGAQLPGSAGSSPHPYQQQQQQQQHQTPNASPQHFMPQSRTPPSMMNGGGGMQAHINTNGSIEISSPYGGYDAVDRLGKRMDGYRTHQATQLAKLEPVMESTYAKVRNDTVRLKKQMSAAESGSQTKSRKNASANGVLGGATGAGGRARNGPAAKRNAAAAGLTSGVCGAHAGTTPPSTPMGGGPPAPPLPGNMHDQSSVNLMPNGPNDHLQSTLLNNNKPAKVPKPAVKRKRQTKAQAAAAAQLAQQQQQQMMENSGVQPGALDANRSIYKFDPNSPLDIKPPSQMNLLSNSVQLNSSSMPPNGAYGGMNIKQENDYFESINIDQQAIDDLISGFDAGRDNCHSDFVLQDSKDFLAILDGNNAPMVNGNLNGGGGGGVPASGGGLANGPHSFDVDSQIDELIGNHFGDAEFIHSLMQDIAHRSVSSSSVSSSSSSSITLQSQTSQHMSASFSETTVCGDSNGSLLNHQLQQSSRCMAATTPNSSSSTSPQYANGVPYNEHSSTPPAINSPQQMYHHHQQMHQHQQRSMMSVPNGGGAGPYANSSSLPIAKGVPLNQSQQLSRPMPPQSQVPASSFPGSGGGGGNAMITPGGGQMSMPMNKLANGPAMMMSHQSNCQTSGQYSVAGPANNAAARTNPSLLLQMAPSQTNHAGAGGLSHNSPQDSPRQIMSPSMSMVMRANNTPSPHQTLTSPHNTMPSAGPGTSPSPAGCLPGAPAGAGNANTKMKPQQQQQQQQQKSSPHGWNQQNSDYFVGPNVSPQMVRMAQVGGGGGAQMNQQQQQPQQMMRMPLNNAQFNGQQQQQQQQIQLRQQQMCQGQQQQQPAKLGMYAGNGGPLPTGSIMSMPPGANVVQQQQQQQITLGNNMQVSNNYGYQQMQRMPSHNQQQQQQQHSMAPNYTQQQQQQMIRAQRMRAAGQGAQQRQQQTMRGQTMQTNQSNANQMAYGGQQQQSMAMAGQQQRFISNGPAQSQQQSQQQYWAPPQQQQQAMGMSSMAQVNAGGGGDAQFQQAYHHQQLQHHQPQQTINNANYNGNNGFY